MSQQNTMEFALEGKQFRANRMHARQQFHLSRRLAPLLPPIGRMLVAKGKHGFLLAELFRDPAEGDAKDLTPDDLQQLLDLTEPVAAALAGMKDDDADKIFEETLSTVQVESSPGTWVPVWIPKGNASLIPELNDFAALIPIIIRVVVFNLGNFMNGFPTNRGEPKAATGAGVPSPAVKTG